MIEVHHLSKAYGSFYAVSDVSFRVGAGEIVGFLGPNGAGKSTTLRILAGFLGATRGKVTIAGHDVESEPLEARAKVGYMPETSPLYPEMKVAEYLAYRAELKRVPRRARADAVDKALASAHIDDVAGVIIGHLSKGYRQRVGLADALVASPPILILDEPTAGLDPNQIRDVRALIRDLGRERTVLLSTHILSEVESTCSRALVIAKGKLVAEGSIDAIRKLRRASSCRVVVRGDAQTALAAARGAAGVTKVEESARGSEVALTITLAESDESDESDHTIEGVVAALVGAGLGVREVTKAGASLEEVFSELTEEAR